MSGAGTHRAHTILAVSDVHSPRYLMHYLSALRSLSGVCGGADAIIWAGDMVERGRVEALAPVLEYTARMCKGARIVAVFGNEEYVGTEGEYLRRYGDRVTWLNDSYAELGEDLVVYGTRGSLDRPTAWQRRNMPWLAREYRERARRLAEVVAKLRERYSYVIVVMHYAPTYVTLEGEPRHIWPELGSRLMEEAIRRSAPTLVIHGHAHRSRRTVASVGGVTVVNVALPARRKLTLVRLGRDGVKVE